MSSAQRMQYRGRSPRTFGTAWENRTHHPTRSSVSLATAVGCTVLGAPRSRDRRGRLDATVGPARFCPCFPRCINRALTDQRFIFRGHSPRTISYGRTDVVRRPRPGGRGSPPLRCVGRWAGNVVGDAPTPVSTPQSRREAPRQLPLPGSRGSRCGVPTLSVIPRRPQPFSRGAKRRDSSPFRGAEGGCGAERMRITDVLPHPTPDERGKRTGIRAEFRSFLCAETPAGISF